MNAPAPQWPQGAATLDWRACEDGRLLVATTTGVYAVDLPGNIVPVPPIQAQAIWPS